MGMVSVVYLCVTHRWPDWTNNVSPEFRTNYERAVRASMDHGVTSEWKSTEKSPEVSNHENV